jgi:hypothetical protein
MIGVMATAQRSRLRLRTFAGGVAVILAGLAAFYFRDAQHLPHPSAVAPAKVRRGTSAMVATLAQSSGVSVEDAVPAGADVTRVIVAALGIGGWPAFAYSDQILRRVVATVDALPRADLPRRVRVLRPVRGSFATIGPDDSPRADPANAARYEPLVAALERLDPAAVADLYVRLYPRLQQQYVDLGMTGQSFHARLLEALGDLLAAPAVPAQVALSRPNVDFVYADPALERLSAGQKALLRLGPQGEARAKAQLERIRAAIDRQGPR